jgi:hypothetical protein
MPLIPGMRPYCANRRPLAVTLSGGGPTAHWTATDTPRRARTGDAWRHRGTDRPYPPHSLAAEPASTWYTTPNTPLSMKGRN